jgi:hypothetical protein
MKLLEQTKETDACERNQESKVMCSARSSLDREQLARPATSDETVRHLACEGLRKSVRLEGQS